MVVHFQLGRKQIEFYNEKSRKKYELKFEKQEYKTHYIEPILKKLFSIFPNVMNIIEIMSSMNQLEIKQKNVSFS